MKLICEGKKIVLRQDAAANYSTILVGQSGYGKSTGMKFLVENHVCKGGSAVVLGTDMGKEQLKDLSRENIKNISVKDGICLYSFACNGAAGIAEVLSNGFHITKAGEKQEIEAAVESAVEETREQGEKTVSTSRIIEKMSSEGAGKELISRFSYFFKHVEVTFSLSEPEKDSVQKTAGNIYLVDADYLSSENRTQLFELLISEIYTFKKAHPDSKQQIQIFLDEFHKHFQGRTDVSSIAKILTEGRKFHLGITLATQSFENSFSNKKTNVLEQAAYIFLFHPVEADANRFIRNYCFTEVWDKEQWKNVLLELDKGECMLYGDHSVAGKENFIEKGPRRVTVVSE